ESGCWWRASSFSRSPSRPPPHPEALMATYQLRPLSFGELLDGALVLLRRHFGLVLSIAVVCEGIPTAMDVYIDLTGGASLNSGLSLLDRLLTLVGSVLVTGATVRVVSEAYLGRSPLLGGAVGRGRVDRSDPGRVRGCRSAGWHPGRGHGRIGHGPGGARRVCVVAHLSGDFLRLHCLLLRPASPQGRLRPRNAEPPAGAGHLGQAVA